MQSDVHLSKQLRKLVDAELEPGESIRWILQPIPRFFTGVALLTVLFGIPWTGFSVFWMWNALGLPSSEFDGWMNPKYLFALFGIPFVLIGVALLLMSLWVWLATRQTVYLITDKRAILMQGGGGSTTIRSYRPEQFRDVYRKERADGSGDVILMVRQWKDNEGDILSEEVGFLGIQNPRQIEQALKQMAR